MASRFTRPELQAPQVQEWSKRRQVVFTVLFGFAMIILVFADKLFPGLAQ